MSPAHILGFVRRAVLALVTVGTVGFAIELLLIDHFEDSSQVIPLALAGAALAVIAWTAIRPGIAALRALQFLMLCYVGAGIVGITLHVEANIETQRETDPTLGGPALFWKMAEATAPPVLAPAILIELGLLGLLYTYRHPALGEQDFADAAGDDIHGSA